MEPMSTKPGTALPLSDWTDDPEYEARRIAGMFPDGLMAWMLATLDAARSQPDEGLLREAVEFIEHLADYDERGYSHVDCYGEPGQHAPLEIEARRFRSALRRPARGRDGASAGPRIAGDAAEVPSPHGSLDDLLFGDATVEELRAYLAANHPVAEAGETRDYNPAQRLHPDDGYSYEECGGPACRAIRAKAGEQ